MVGSGNQLFCNTIYHQVPVTLDTHTFHTDFVILPLSGQEVVSGVQWIKTVGPIITYYSELTMSFQWQNAQISLHGIKDGQLESISSSQLKCMHVTQAIAEFYQLHIYNSISA